MKLLPLVLVIGMVGCGSANNTRPVEENSHPVDWYKLGSESWVGDFRLDDGTRCVVYSSYKKGGITCNWRVEARGVEK